MLKATAKLIGAVASLLLSTTLCAQSSGAQSKNATANSAGLNGTIAAGGSARLALAP